MAANYLHGVETIEVENGARPVKTVKSAVIGLIGTAPMGDVNTLVQCLSEKDAAAFGSQLTGFTIPQALDAIYDHGAGTVLVINVLDPAVHKTAVADEDVTFDKATGKAQLANPVVAQLVLKPDSDGQPYVEGQDYSLDAQTGVITNLGKSIAADATVKASYNYADPTKVTPADIIGAVNAAGNRTGMKLLNDSFNLFGYFAKILIAPV
ncbi:phage tail sheath family protein, partial [Escherichia coli]|nr:phage tail sheath family protein [Escherichia coli]